MVFINFILFYYSGPDKIKIVGATSVKVHLTDLIPGTYVMKLTVTDDKKLTGSDTVKIHVKKSRTIFKLKTFSIFRIFSN